MVTIFLPYAGSNVDSKLKSRQRNSKLVVIFSTIGLITLPSFIVLVTVEFLSIAYNNKLVRDEFCTFNHYLMTTADLDRASKQLVSNLSILCLCLTTASYHQSRARFVAETWGRRCTELVFLSDLQDPELPGSKSFSSLSSYNSLWCKTRSGFEWAYRANFNRFDWILKADDDSYFFMNDLARFLLQFNASKEHYFGRNLLGALKSNGARVPYADGGAGYILSKEALKSLNEKAFTLGNWINCAPSDRTVAEDVEMGRCLGSIGIHARTPVESVESGKLCHKFLLWPPWKDISAEKTDYIRTVSEPCTGAGWHCAQNMLSLHNLTGAEMKFVEKFYDNK